MTMSPDSESGVSPLLAQLIELMPDAIVVVGLDHAIILANVAAESMFGYDPGALLGMPLGSLLPESLRERHDAHVEQFFAAPSKRHMGRGQTLLARRCDGALFPVEVALNEVPWPGGRAFAAAIRDVSDRVRALEEQRRSRDRLLVTDRMASIGMLAAGVAHEINNPLAAVAGNLEFLEGALDPSESEVRAALRDARQGVEHVRAITLDLKVFSREVRHGAEVADAVRVVESSLRMARNEIQHRARVSCAFEPAPPIALDESRLGQVVLNLVVNAAQAIPEGDIARNEIHVAVRSAAEDRVLIEVRDTGVGMPPEVADKIFTPFFTTKSSGSGTGIGLSIAKRIVTEAGGNIDVESEVGRGAIFRVLLPAAKAPLPEPPAHATASAATRRGAVLVIDDEAPVAAMIRRLLRADHDVTAVSSAHDALARIESGERFDVVLCDLMMPQMTGMEFHARLLEVAPEVARRVVFLTGGAFTSKARAFLDAVPNERIEKPFERAHLRAVVNRYMDP